jgi:hypothetical protein
MKVKCCTALPLKQLSVLGDQYYSCTDSMFHYIRSSNEHVPKGLTTFVPDTAAFVFQHYSMKDIMLHEFLPMAPDGCIKSACSGRLTPEDMSILLQDS